MANAFARFGGAVRKAPETPSEAFRHRMKVGGAIALVILLAGLWRTPAQDTENDTRDEPPQVRAVAQKVAQ